MNVIRGRYCLALALLWSSSAAAGTWFVDLNIHSGSEDGTEWATAFPRIQQGIDAAAADGGGEVWVAEGTYDHTRLSLFLDHNDDDPDLPVDTGSLVMREGVDVYGGFAGAESLRSERDPKQRLTIIDGSKSRAGEPALHVVWFNGEGRLDGFAISGGNASGENFGLFGAGIAIVELSPTIAQCIIRDNLSALLAAGVGNLSGSPIFEDCRFENNIAPLGGAVCNQQGGTPIFRRCEFTNNLADFGGTMNNFDNAFPIIEDSIFTKNVGLSGGGAICSGLQCSPLVRNCTFDQNVSDGGGAFENFDRSNIEVFDSVFSSNLAITAGGVMVVVDNSSGGLFGCTFESNEAEVVGGVLYSGFDSVITFASCEFVDNASALDGGVVLNDDSVVEMTDCLFTGNEAKTGIAGALFNHQGTLIVRRSTFSQNEAADLGGAIYTEDATEFVLDKSTFVENEARSGGALFIRHSAALVESCNFVENIARDGGAIAVLNDGGEAVHVMSSIFDANIAETGGAMAHLPGSLGILSVSRSRFSRNRANFGGALSDDAGLEAVNCIFSRNKAGLFGGALLNSPDGNATLSQCTLAYNSGPGYGGLAGATEIRNEGALAVENSVVWPKNEFVASLITVTGAATQVSNSLVRGGAPGIDNLDADPLLIDPFHGNLRFRAMSPCRDAATDSDVDVDFLGIPRSEDGGPDIGAFEFVDTDGDDMDDRWEMEVGLNPEDPLEAELDTDGDDLTNLDEFEMGTRHNDSTDPPSQVFVSPLGGDESGEGSELDPWRTIQFALESSRHFARDFHPVTVRARAGTYEEKLVLGPYTTLEGVGNETVIEFFAMKDQNPEHAIITGAVPGASLRHLRILIPPTDAVPATGILALNEAIEIDHVEIDGGSNEGSMGVLFSTSPGHGLQSDESQLIDSTIRRTADGVVARAGARANIARTLFDTLSGDAVILSETLKTAKGLVLPELTLGDESRFLETGLNRFRTVTGRLVSDDTGHAIQAQNNDWGISSENGIGAHVPAIVSFIPFVGTRLMDSDLVFKLTDASTGEIIALENEPRVQAFDKGDAAEMDDASGLLVLNHTGSGSLRIVASADGFTSAELDVTGDDGSITPVLIALEPMASGCAAGGAFSRTTRTTTGDHLTIVSALLLLALFGRRQRSLIQFTSTTLVQMTNRAYKQGGYRNVE